jgi:hypothetical protein
MSNALDKKLVFAILADESTTAPFWVFLGFFYEAVDYENMAFYDAVLEYAYKWEY